MEWDIADEHPKYGFVWDVREVCRVFIDSKGSMIVVPLEDLRKESNDSNVR